jgi:D-cysteine desulfhydrase
VGGPSQSTCALQARLPRSPSRLDLCARPTPVQRSPWLDIGSAEVWVKRDDASSPIYGGGKVRKLEWVLANPPYDGNDPILSVGGVGSHHLLALALFLREQGRQLHALTFTQTLTDHVRTNLAVMLSCGAELWNVPSRAAMPWAFLAYHGWRKPEVPGRYMAAGASTALGCFGFVDAGLELGAQIDAGLVPPPRTVFVAAGSAGASAGLALGLVLAGVRTHLHLVSSVEPLIFNRFLYRRKLAEAWSRLRRHGLAEATKTRSVTEALAEGGVTWTIDHSEVGGGYGVPTPSGLEAVALAAEHGLRLETTYTAKCLAAMRRAITDEIVPGGPVLFWNTHAGNDLAAYIEPGWETRSPVALTEDAR